MSVLSVNIPVPVAGDGPIVSVAGLAGLKTILLSGRFSGYYDLLASHDDIHFAAILQFSAGGVEAIYQTIPGAFKSVRLRSNAVADGVVACAASAVDVAAENHFAVLASLPAGFGGTTISVDAATLFGGTPEADICVICEGGFRGLVVVEGSTDNTNWNPVTSFRVDRVPTGAPASLSFSAQATLDKVRYLRVNSNGVVISTTTVTLGARVPISPLTVFALRDLSNLLPTSINQSLVPDAAGTRDLGTTAKPFRNIEIAGTVVGVTTAITGTKNNALVFSIPTQGTSDADGVGLTIAADAGGSGGTGNHNGGDITLSTGAGAGSGTAGNVIVTRGSVGVGTTGAPTYQLQLNRSGGGAVFGVTGAGQNVAYGQMQNTGAQLIFGIERNTGGGLVVGSAAYASVLGTQNATSLQLATNNTVRCVIDSSGDVSLTGILSVPDGAAGTPSIRFNTDPTCGIYHTGNGGTGTIELSINGVRGAVLTSVGLGVGTQVPITVFDTDVSSGTSTTPNAFFKNNFTGNVGGIRAYATVDASGGYFAFTGRVVTTSGVIPATMTSDASGRAQGCFGWVGAPTLPDSMFYFGTAIAGASRAVTTGVTISGNGVLSIGSTTTLASPNPNQSYLRIGNSQNLMADTTLGVTASLSVNQNAYFDSGGWKYINAAGAGNYNQAAGTHYWRVAPVGVVGAAITWTTAATIDNGANFCIGVTTAGATAAGTLVLSNTATAPTASADRCHIYAADLSAGNATLAIYTETAVAADVGLASTHSLTVFIGGAKYKIMLVSVP